MTMGNQVSQQLLVFGQSILLGIAVGVLYDLLRPFRQRRDLLPVSAAAGRGRIAGIHAPWRRGRSSGVFLRVFAASASRLGFLGGYAGLLGIFVVFPAALGEKILQKNSPPRKKSLLFCEKMLYNKKNWVHLFIAQRRRTWQTNNTQKRSPVPGPAF